MQNGSWFLLFRSLQSSLVWWDDRSQTWSCRTFPKLKKKLKVHGEDQRLLLRPRPGSFFDVFPSRSPGGLASGWNHDNALLKTSLPFIGRVFKKKRRKKKAWQNLVSELTSSNFLFLCRLNYLIVRDSEANRVSGSCIFFVGYLFAWIACCTETKARNNRNGFDRGLQSWASLSFFRFINCGIDFIQTTSSSLRSISVAERAGALQLARIFL